MNQTEFEQQLSECKAMVEARLAEFFPGDGLQESMRYSLLAGGKRIRPILTMKFCEACGGTPEQALDFGCGVEMLHTYSLIHDDLPCMDNDDLRRGKPTNHKVYGECTATIAGDALQAAAFETVASAKGDWAPEVPALAVGVLAASAGGLGMCGGQYLDTLSEGQSHTEEELTEINDLKTGALLRAAAVMGVLASTEKCVDEKRIEAAKTYAANFGLAFQIRDDLLDVIGDEETFGKPIGSDKQEAKTTFVDLFGVEGCMEKVHSYTEAAKAALDEFEQPEFLQMLADSMVNRNY